MEGTSKEHCQRIAGSKAQCSALHSFVPLKCRKTRPTSVPLQWKPCRILWSQCHMLSSLSLTSLITGMTPICPPTDRLLVSAQTAAEPGICFRVHLQWKYGSTSWRITWKHLAGGGIKETSPLTQNHGSKYKYLIHFLTLLPMPSSPSQ